MITLNTNKIFVAFFMQKKLHCLGMSKVILLLDLSSKIANSDSSYNRYKIYKISNMQMQLSLSMFISFLRGSFKLKSHIPFEVLYFISLLLLRIFVIVCNNERKWKCYAITKDLELLIRSEEKNNNHWRPNTTIALNLNTRHREIHNIM